MTDRKHPTYVIPDTKFQDESDGNALFVMCLVQQPALPQDVYSPNEVAQLLHISKKRVYHYATRPRNPLPLRKWSNGEYGSFVLHDELIEWLRSNTLLPEGCRDSIQKKRPIHINIRLM